MMPYMLHYNVSTWSLHSLPWFEEDVSSWRPTRPPFEELHMSLEVNCILFEVLVGDVSFFGGDHGYHWSTCQSQLTILGGCYLYLLFSELVA